jgi:hypothetical protein
VAVATAGARPSFTSHSSPASPWPSPSAWRPTATWCCTAGRSCVVEAGAWRRALHSTLHVESLELAATGRRAWLTSTTFFPYTRASW